MAVRLSGIAISSYQDLDGAGRKTRDPNQPRRPRKPEQTLIATSEPNLQSLKRHGSYHRDTGGSKFANRSELLRVSLPTHAKTQERSLDKHRRE